jgi:hypothetical protein
MEDCWQIAFFGIFQMSRFSGIMKAGKNQGNEVMRCG